MEKPNSLQSNGIGIIAECEDCKNKFELSGINLIRKKFLFEGQVVFLSFYDCPNCGKRHYAQIDNVKTLEQLKDITKQMHKLANYKRCGNQVQQKQSAKFKKTREHLAQSRNNLMKEFTGKNVIDAESGIEVFDLRFSV